MKAREKVMLKTHLTLFSYVSSFLCLPLDLIPDLVEYFFRVAYGSI